MKIRMYAPSDAKSLWQLKHDTIHAVNSADYTQAQLCAWAPASLDREVWQTRIDAMHPFIVELEGKTVGFADLQDDGYIDHFFCHSQHQRQGVGRALMAHILAIGHQRGITRFYSHVSITAKPFFERFGFRVVKEQQVAINGQVLTNFLMEKRTVE